MNSQNRGLISSFDAKKIGVLFAAAMFIIGGFFVASLPAQATITPLTRNVDGINGDDATGLPYKTIQAAVTAANSGDTINVAAGTYAEELLIDGKTNLTIQGVGDGSLIEPAYNDTGTAGITIVNSNGLTIQDLKIHTSGREMEGIWVYGVGNGGNAITGLTIHNTTIDVAGGSAGQAAAGIIGDAASDAAHSDWHITDNRITIAGTGSTPMVLQDVSASEFSRNVVTNSSAGASTIWSSERQNLAGITFSDNQFNGGANRQIYFLTDYNQISGGTNIPVENPAVPTTISGVTFHGNTFSSWGQGALRVGEISTGHISNFNITNNTFGMTADTDLPIAIMAGVPTLTGGGNSSEQNVFNVSGMAKIQDAIDAAFAGDVINVAAGIYVESISVNKSVTIAGVGKDSNVDVNTVVQPVSGNAGFIITAHDVTIRDLRVVVDSSDGISIKAADDVTINNLDIEKTGASGGGPGIFIYGTGSGSGASTSASSNRLTIIKSTINVANENNGIYASNTTPAHSGWTIGGSAINANTISTGGTPLELHDVTSSTVSHNSITGVSGTPVIWESNLSNIADIIFSNNAISGGTGSQVSFISDYFYSDPSSAPYPGDTVDTSITGITIQGNIFSGWGARALRIGMDGIGRVTGATVNQNKFLSAGLALTNADTGASVDATNNYWGEANPDFATKISTLGGAVDYDPWYFDGGLTQSSATIEEIFSGIGSTLAANGVDSNIGTVTASNLTSFPNLYFEKSIDGVKMGKIKFTSALDLSSNDTKTFLENLASKMEANKPGVIGLDFTGATDSVALKNKTAEIKFYGLDKLGFDTTLSDSDLTTLINSKLIALNDDGSAVADKASLLPVAGTFVGACEVGGGCNTFTVGVNHFTKYQITALDQIIPDDDGTVTVTEETPEVVVNDPDLPLIIETGSVDNATVDYGSLIAGGTGTIPQTTINSDRADVEIPASTTVTRADPTWDGIIAAPKVTTVTLPDVSGETETLGTAIEVGFTGAKLSFDKAVRLLLPGQAGKRVGYVRTGITFTEITNVCAADNQATGDALAADGDCKISVGADMVIWTKHFTAFATYTSSVTPAPASPASGGGSPLPVSNAYTNWLAQSGQGTITTPVPTVETQGQVLGEQTYADGALLRAVNGIDVYIIKYKGAKQFKRLILSPSVFNSYQHLKWSDVLNVEQSVLDSFVTSDLVRAAGDTKVYKLTPSGDTGTKQWVKTAEAFLRLGYDWDAVYQINSVDRDSYTTSADIE